MLFYAYVLWSGFSTSSHLFRVNWLYLYMNTRRMSFNVSSAYFWHTKSAFNLTLQFRQELSFPSAEEMFWIIHYIGLRIEAECFFGLDQNVWMERTESWRQTSFSRARYLVCLLSEQIVPDSELGFLLQLHLLPLCNTLQRAFCYITIIAGILTSSVPDSKQDFGSYRL